MKWIKLTQKFPDISDVRSDYDGGKKVSVVFAVKDNRTGQYEIFDGLYCHRKREDLERELGDKLEEDYPIGHSFSASGGDWDITFKEIDGYSLDALGYCPESGERYTVTHWLILEPPK